MNPSLLYHNVFGGHFLVTPLATIQLTCLLLTIQPSSLYNVPPQKSKLAQIFSWLVVIVSLALVWRSRQRGSEFNPLKAPVKLLSEGSLEHVISFWEDIWFYHLPGVSM